MAQYTDAEGFAISSNAQSPDEIREAVEVPEKISGRAIPAKDGEGKGGKETKPAREAAVPTPSTKTPAATPKAGNAVPAEPETEDGEPSGSPSRNPTARMLKATKEASELRHRLEAEQAETRQVRARLEALEKLARQAAGGERQAVDPRIPPRAEDFEDQNDYIDARTRWMLQQELEYRDSRARVQQEVETHIRGVGEKIDSFKSKYTAHPDRERVNETVSGLIPSIFVGEGTAKTAENGLADALILAEDPVPIMVYLSEHEDELQKILDAKSQPEIDRRLARIETLLELESGGEPVEPKSTPATVRKVSAAHPPIKPLPTRTGKGDNDDLESMPIDEYIETMNKRDIERKKHLM